METAIILGQGITGSTLAWRLHWRGDHVHLVDRGDKVTASRVAAGLITPFTGKNMTKAGDFDACLEAAERFYTKVEEALGEELLERNPSVRLFSSDEERERYQSRIATKFPEEVEQRRTEQWGKEGFLMLKARRLRVLRYLEATREYFTGRGQYHQADVNISEHIHVSVNEVRMTHPELAADRLYFCQGFQSATNSWFPGIPDAPARGEILRLRIPGRRETAVVHQGYWLAPAASASAQPQSDEFLLGATYDRENLTSGVTEEGRSELLSGLRRITQEAAEVVEHLSAVRASTRQRRPVAQIHERWPQLAIVNGMGSKATLMAPQATEELLRQISAAREKREPKPQGKSLTQLAHSIVRRAIRPGDTVIDATAGNGHDTAFLSRCTGTEGAVLSIDSQPAAIESTYARLLKEEIHNVRQLKEDHAEVLSDMAERHESVRAIMFNLGYLPGSDKHVTTSAESTVKAVRAGLKLLDRGGVMTVIAYRGHPGGQQEWQALEELSKGVSAEESEVEKVAGFEGNPESPVLFIFRRKQR
jgi:glycine/D-amino acid oxidase-like deaminating enzyme/predicted methyltransferase